MADTSHTKYRVSTKPGEDHFLLSERPTVRRVLQNLKWDDVEFDEVQTCIATANRMFNGYAVRGHPVRQAYEMMNVLEGGIITLGTDVLCVWREEQFSTTDLADYLAGVTTHKDFFEAMEQRELAFKLGSQELVFETFSLNPQRMLELGRARYRDVTRDSKP